MIEAFIDVHSTILFLLWALQVANNVELPDATLGNLKIQKQRSSGANPVFRVPELRYFGYCDRYSQQFTQSTSGIAEID
ncbi:hypothetical protein [Planktothrix sp.]|uniref:hypothetical protein n=1 Tax=Planktothrix sp. TaxID=3088171 RepID=UPI0038D37D71